MLGRKESRVWIKVGFFKKIKCEVCDKKFSKEEERMNHKQIVHGKDLKYDCKECSKYFALWTLKSRKKRAEFISYAGSSGLALSGSTNRLLGDYYRIEGRYKASLDRNMDINLSQYNRTMEAIQFGQESQSTYLTPPNSKLLFASAALGFANNYYNLQRTKQNQDIK